jgi:hypothetical protein
VAALVALGAAGPVARPSPSWRMGPRSAVLGVLVTIAVLGVARKWLEAHRARVAIERLRGDACTADEILDAPRHGRAVLLDLFRLLAEAPTAQMRSAAGTALAELWAANQLVGEEEKAVVTRGYEVSWRGRRRYPRELRATIRLEVRFGLPFLASSEERVVRADQLLWQYRVAGSRRASLEAWSDWVPGPVVVSVPIEPGDFAGNGPHRLVLEARVRTCGLTESWEHSLPSVQHTFEFDQILRVDALYALPDSSRATVMSQAVVLEEAVAERETESRFVWLAEGYATRSLPELVVREPLPCDLSHRAWVELEGVEGRWAIRPVVVPADGQVVPTHILIRPDAASQPLRIEHPGTYRVRAVLEPDANLGWTEPEIRSVWPERVVTNWVDVDVIRS